jgi:hypothetical protein
MRRVKTAAGRADDPRALSRDLAFYEHGDECVASDAVPFRDEKHVSALERVQSISQSGPMFESERARESGVGERRYD